MGKLEHIRQRMTNRRVLRRRTDMEFLKLNEVVQRTSLSRSEVYRRIHAGTFPNRITLGEGRVAWLASEVTAWQKAQIEARNAAQ